MSQKEPKKRREKYKNKNIIYLTMTESRKNQENNH